jgi:hypothetical protein
MSILLYIMFNLCTIMLYYCLSFYLSNMYNSFIFIYYIYFSSSSSSKQTFGELTRQLYPLYIFIYMKQILSTISFLNHIIILLRIFFSSLFERFRRNNFGFFFSLFFFFFSSLFVLIKEAKIN